MGLADLGRSSVNRFRCLATLLLWAWVCLPAVQAQFRSFTLGGSPVLLERAEPSASVYFKAFRPNRETGRWDVDVMVTNGSTRILRAPVLLRFETAESVAPGIQGAVLDTAGKPFFNLSALVPTGGFLPGTTLRTFKLSIGDAETRPELEVALYGATDQRFPLAIEDAVTLPQGSGAVTVAVLDNDRTAPGAGGILRVTGVTSGSNGEVRIQPDGTGLIYRPAPGFFGPDQFTYVVADGLGGTDTGTVRVTVERVDGSLTLALVRVLTGDGLPFEGAMVEELGPESPRTRTVGRGGWLSLESGAAIRGWRFHAPGQEPVFRTASDLKPGAVTEIPTVRLVLAEAGAFMRFPLEALPAPLPRGWSPAVWVRSDAGPRPVELSEIIPVGREALWVQWDGAGRVWRSVGRVTGNGLRTVAFEFPAGGLFALVLPDSAPLSPSIPAGGGILTGVEAVETPGSLRAVGSVDPASASASRDAARVTARARVEFTSSAGALSSGLEIPCEIVEEYRLRDGTRRRLPAYGLRLVAQRPPGAAVAGPLVAEFPVRPFQLLAGEELSEAIVRVEVLAPAAFAGGILKPDGGTLESGGIRIRAGQGDVAGPEAVLLRESTPVPAAEFVPAGTVVVRAFELSVGATVGGGRLRLETLPQDAHASYVLARAVFDEGFHGYQPVERFISDAAGVLSAVEPESNGLPGIDGGGQYLLFRTPAREALVEGVARNAAGQPTGGLRVRRGPWSAITDELGRFRLLAPAGPAEVAVVDPRSGDSGSSSMDVPSALTPVPTVLDAAARGPRIVSVVPTNGATGVARVTPVAVSFNRPLNPLTVVGAGVQLLDASGTPVPASVSLNVSGTTVTLLPVNPLTAATGFQVRVAATVADFTGRPVEGQRESGFTTQDDTLVRGLAAQVTIYEPGATNLTAALLARIPSYDPARDREGIVVEGSPGTAESRQPVVLVNESSGETQTVVSEVDGSFVSFVRGTVDDFISAVLVNANGTRNLLPATRQRFDDGTIGLFGSGGTIRSTGPGTPVDLIVEPGSIRGKTLFKLESMEAATFSGLVGGKFPEESGALVGAFELTESGDPLLNAADISVPVRRSELGLPPGTDLTNVSFVVVMPLRVDGRVVHQIVDTATFEADGPDRGRVRTASPPFVGMLARKLAELGRSAGMSVVTVPKGASTGDNPHKGETAAFGILPLISRGPLKVGGFVRVLKDHADGTQETENLPGATVRVARLQDEGDGAPLVFDGDLVSISDERGSFGFFFRPSEATTTRALLATHPRFPFQRPRTGAFVGERQGTTVVNAELHFRELPPSQTVFEGAASPVVSVGHEPTLPASGAGDGATVFVVGVDDRLVGPPTLQIASVENLRGEPLEVSTATLTRLDNDADQPGRKVRQYRLQLNQPGRVVLVAAVADDLGQTGTAQHAISFGVTRPSFPPGDPEDLAALRVIFAWPPSKSTNLPALTPITLRFNRPLPSALLQPGQLGWLTFDADHTLRRLTASADRREVTLHYDGKTTGAVRLSVSSELQGESGRPLNQDPTGPPNQGFDLGFTQTSGVEVPLEGQSGAGVVMRGRFSYALERTGTGGILKVFDFEDPREPEELRVIQIGYPTAMALIPAFSSPGTAGEACVPQDLLALFTGHANEPKYLQLGRLDSGRVTFGRRLILSGGGTDGAGIPSVAEGVTALESLSQIVKARWSPPYLGYLEVGADVTSIKLVNLAAFQTVVAREGRLDSFPSLAGFDGLDANGDGDFCDAGDQLPVPGSDPLQPPGLAFSTAPLTRAERIEDFDFNAGLGLMVGISRFVGTNLPPRFSVLLAAADTNRLDAAFVEFGAGDSLRRVLLLPATTLETPPNRIVRDIALVTIGGGGDGALAVVDVTVPSAPRLLNRIPVPTGEGTPAGIQMRDDGLLAVATSRSVLLLDPSLLVLPSQGGSHPVFQGRVDGTGTGVRDFVADASGIHLTHGGGNRRYVESAPRFAFVHFNAPIDPADLAAQEASQVERFLRSATPVRVAEVTLAGTGTTPPPVNPERHYYVLVDAPGGAADAEGRLPLVLSAVDANGLPQSERDGTVVPSVLGDEQLYSALLGRRFLEVFISVVNLRAGARNLSRATELKDRLRAALGTVSLLPKALKRVSALGQQLGLVPERFVARRLTDDPGHPLYNRFLAGPFLVLGGAPDTEQLLALRDQALSMSLDRVYLRPSPRLWVGFPSEREKGFLQSKRPFQPDPSRLKPFISQLQLNPRITVRGVEIPLSGELIEQAAAINASPASPLSSFFDLGENVTLLVTLLGNVPLLDLVMKGEWTPLLTPGAHTLLPVNFTERPMILVPGFAGSKLEVNGKTAWVSLSVTDTGRELRELRVNDDGTPAFPTHATDAVRYSIETPLIDLQSIYGTWIEHLTGTLGMVEYDFRKPGVLGAPGGATIRDRLRLGDAALLGQFPTPNLFVFPYDWRLDNQKSAEQLRDYVRLALEMHPDADGVDLVGHSNGGLVARAYMLLPGQRPLVKRFITVGAPWLGAPKPLAGLRTGDMNEAGINVVAPIPSVRKMLQFAPGAHQLLPSKEYFDLGFRPLVEDGYDIDGNGSANDRFGFDAYLETLARHFLREPVEELGLTLEQLSGGEHPVRRNAISFRAGQPIGDHSGDAAGVEMHHIVGFGSSPDTIGQVRVRGRLTSVPATTNITVSLARVTSRETEQVRDGPDLLVSPADGTLAVNPTNQFALREEIEVRYVAGDGTVPIVSLARGYGSPQNLNAPQARVYPLVGAFADELTGHNPMLNSDEFLTLFDRIYGGRPVPQVNLSVGDSSGFSEGSLASLTVSGTRSNGGAGEIRFVVDFGDGGVESKRGTVGVAVQIAHRYRQSGTYLVTVGAATPDGLYGLTSRQVVVANVAPVVSIEGGNLTVDRGETRVLLARVQDAGKDDHRRFTWTHPGGTTSGANQFALPVTFDQPGEHRVQVTVRDESDEASSEITVTVRGQPPRQPGPGFGPEFAATRGRAGLADSGLDGGHPELIVRVNGHAPGTAATNTTGLSVRQFSDLGGGIQLLGGVLESFANLDPFQLATVVLSDFQLPAVARFLGQLGKDTEYVRLLRSPPFELFGADFAATKALVGFRGMDRPIEVDLLYLEGNTPKVIRRWQVPSVSAASGLRLRFDWVVFEGVLERVTPLPGPGGVLDGVAIEVLPPVFSGVGEQVAGDRLGPATVGILNPATDQVTILARDHFTTEANVVLYAVFDANENGRLEDDTFYPLDTNVVDFARLPKRPFAVVGVDEQGNVGALDPFRVSETRNFLGTVGPGQTESEYERKLKAIQGAVRATIVQARDSEVIRGRFLLKPEDLWVFEQGSGANLWKSDFVSRCNGIYLPGKSDNDYELFLPLRLVDGYTFTEASRLRFEADGPHRPVVLTGDWYFRRPAGLDAAGVATEDDGAVVSWQYTLPDGITTADGETGFRVNRRADDSDLAAGFRSPLTPAEVIAREFTRTVTSDPVRRKLLPDTSFFPERREHFMFGRLHLQRPPEFGDDPIGDGGTGRQMLMLKWLLEGSFVTATDGGGADAFSPGAPSLAAVYGNWQRVGVPRAEGLEWGLFHDFVALKSRPFQVAEMRLSTGQADARLRLLQRSIDDAVAQQQASRLKKLGKAAIRATLARLAGDTNLNALVTGLPASRITDGSVRSFEHEIRDLVGGSSEARAAFGDFATDRDDLTAPPDIGDFLRAKNGDREYLALLVNEPGAYERFVSATFTFLREVVQRPVLSPYMDYTGGLQASGQLDELQQRTDNLNLVVQGRGAGRPGLLGLNSERRVARTPLPLSVETYGPGNAGNLELTSTRSSIQSPIDPPVGGGRSALPAGDGDEVTRVVTVVRALADQDDVVDEDVGNLPTLEGGPIERTVEQEVSTRSGPPQDAIADDTVTAVATVIARGAPAPVYFPNELSAFVNGFDELLTDWPALPDGHPRSPRVVLKRDDRIFLRLITQPGMGTITVLAKGEFGDSQALAELAEVEPGIYQTANATEGIGVTGDPTDPLRLLVQDEDLLRFELVLSIPNVTVRPLEVMVDRAEKATTSLSFTDRTGFRAEPRPSVHRTLVNDLGYFDNGDLQNPDNVGSPANQGSNPMRDFLISFGRSGPGETEADVLYWLSHGVVDGRLLNHAAGPGGRVIVEPRALPDPATYWRKDPEFLVLHACWALNEPSDLGNEEINTLIKLVAQGFDPRKISPGMGAWHRVISSHARPLHAIFGFTRVTSQNSVAQMKGFLEMGTRMSVVNAWELANTTIGQPRPWAVGFYDNNFDDTLLRVQRDPLPNDPFATDRLILPMDVADAEELGVPGSTSSRGDGVAPRTATVPPLLPRALRLRFPALPENLRELPELPASGSLSDVAFIALAQSRFTVDTGGAPAFQAGPVGRIERSWLRSGVEGPVRCVGRTADFRQTWLGLPVENLGAAVLMRSDRPGWIREHWAELMEHGPLSTVLSEPVARRAAERIGKVSKAPARLEYVQDDASAERRWVPAWILDRVDSGGGSTVRIHAVTGEVVGGAR